MQVFMFKSIVMEAWENRRKICLLVLICAIVGGVIGFVQSKQLPKTPDGGAIARYEQGLKSYENALQAAKKNLQVAEDQLKKEQEYVEKAPYMKIDPQKQQWGELSYRVDAPERINDVIQSYNNFVNRSWLAGKIASKLPTEPAPYIKEGMWSGNNGNMWTVTVVRKDATEVARILAVMKEAIEDYKNEVKFEHRLTLAKEINYTRADQGTLKNQNGHRDLVRRYTNDVRNYNNQIVETSKQLDNYMRVHKPPKIEVKNPSKAVTSYAIMGAIIGLLVPLVLLSLKNTMDNRLKSLDELLMLNLPIVCTVEDGDYKPALVRVAVELGLISRQNNSDQLSCCTLLNVEEAGKCFEQLHASLALEGLDLLLENDIANDAEQLKELAKIGHCVVIVKLGETRYRDIQNCLLLCKKISVDVVGLVVIA